MRPGAACLLLFLGTSAAHAAADQQAFEEIARGRYLAIAGDCAGCHNAPGGAPYAGGLPIETPFGTLVSPNITPDRETGIGAWTDDEFVNAMRDGTRRGGEHLYPAMPYTYYTKAAREDVLAIRAYLQTLEPVRNEVKANQLPFPFNVRASMRGVERTIPQARDIHAGRRKIGRMEPWRLLGGGSGALRVVPHGEERNGRRRDCPRAAGRCTARMVRPGPDGRSAHRLGELVGGRRHRVSEDGP